MFDRNKIRSLLIGGELKFNKSTVEIESNGEKFPVEVRQPTMEGRSAILRASGADEEGKGGDYSKVAAAAIIGCTFVPGTDTRVFGPEDMDAIRALPAGGWCDDLTNAAMALINVKKEAAEKN